MAKPKGKAERKARAAQDDYLDSSHERGRTRKDSKSHRYLRRKMNRARRRDGKDQTNDDDEDV